MELFRRLREFFQTRRTKKTKQIAEMKEKLEHMEKVEKDLDAFNNLMIETLAENKEEKAILLQTVQKLEATLASEREQQEQNITERNSTHLQNITELQSSLKLYEEQEKTVERERESWAREQKQLLERVAQLEVTLKRKKEKKAKLDMEERNNLQLQTIRELQDSLNLCEKENNNLMRDRDQLETRLALREATLLSEQNKHRKEKEKAKHDLEEMTTSHIQITRKLQDSLNHCEEEKKRAEHKRNNLMRERERLEELVVELDETLEFVSEFEKKQKTKQNITRFKTRFLNNSRRTGNGSTGEQQSTKLWAGLDLAMPYI